ncbi:MAG: hypothetical protein IJZ55_04380 [Lachnospiraceae bacterium]|nr:hypothetical protein [Lachnospiraceae bacterium]
MLEQTYKEMMNGIKPDAALVEAMVERQSERKKGVFFLKPMKAAVAVLCGLMVLAGGTVAVDAATGGAVRKLFGFRDSVVNGVYEAEYVERKLEYKNHYRMTLYDENGEKRAGFVSKQDTPVFSFRIEYKNVNTGNVFMPLTLHELESEDAYTWRVYWLMNSLVKEALCQGRYEYGSEDYEGLVDSIEAGLEEIDRSTELGELCALGIQYAIEDLKENRNCRVLSFRILDKINWDEKGNYTVQGFSYVKADLDEWMREAEENGTTEFTVEADGGVKKTYKIKVNSYSPFTYTYEPVE